MFDFHLDVCLVCECSGNKNNSVCLRRKSKLFVNGWVVHRRSLHTFLSKSIKDTLEKRYKMSSEDNSKDSGANSAHSYWKKRAPFSCRFVLVCINVFLLSLLLSLNLFHIFFYQCYCWLLWIYTFISNRFISNYNKSENIVGRLRKLSQYQRQRF